MAYININTIIGNEALIPTEQAVFVDFIDDDISRLRKRLVRRDVEANLISIHRVNEYANHRLVNQDEPNGNICQKKIGPGFVLVWAKKDNR